jgi:hypothetical protein
MTHWPFKNNDLSTVSDALEIAEENTGDFYKFSLNQWKRHHYDVKTLSTLNDGEITSDAFAMLNKRSRITTGFDSKTKGRDFYYICLQDHQILRALGRDENLGVLPLLVYIFTHELVHIVRFCNYYQRYELSSMGREREEKIVHATTYEILKDLSLPKLDYVLEAYQDEEICHLTADN